MESTTQPDSLDQKNNTFIFLIHDENEVFICVPPELEPFLNSLGAACHKAFPEIPQEEFLLERKKERETGLFVTLRRFSEEPSVMRNFMVSRFKETFRAICIDLNLPLQSLST